MRSSTFAGIAISALLVTPAAYAQQSSQTQPQKQQTTEPQKTDKNDKDMAATQTFTGCVMTEPEYRQAHNLGKGMLGGVGLGNEYVIVDAKVSPAKGSMSDTSGMSGSTMSKPTSSNSGKCSDQGMAYRLTGKDEAKIKSLVGKEIEVQGRLKDVTDTTATGTSGTSNDANDKKLPPEVEIVSFHEAGGVDSDMNAPAAQSTTPATPATSSTSAQSTTRTPPRASATEPDPTQTANPPKQLPHSASPMALFALIGGLALISGLALTMMKKA